MTDQPERVKVGRKHFYEYDGTLAPSVTTVLQAIAKPALVGWAAKVTAEWAVENKKMWYGMSDTDAVDLLKKARWRMKEAALGSRVHAAVLEEGDPRGVEGYVEAFDDWSTRHRVTRVGAELPIFNTGSVAYGGTADWVGYVDGERTLVDVKTGKAVYPEAWLQVEAYANADVGLPWQPDRVGVLHLGDGEYEWHVEELSRRRMAAFVGAYQVAEFLGMVEVKEVVTHE